MAVKVIIRVEKPEIWNTGNRAGTVDAIRKTLLLVAEKLKFDGEIPVVLLSSEAFKDGRVASQAPVKLELTNMIVKISSIVSFNRLRERHKGKDLITLPVATAFYAGFTLAQYIAVVRNAELPKRNRLLNPLRDSAILSKNGQVVTSAIKELFDVDIRLS